MTIKEIITELEGMLPKVTDMTFVDTKCIMDENTGLCVSIQMKITNGKASEVVERINELLKITAEEHPMVLQMIHQDIQLLSLEQCN